MERVREFIVITWTILTVLLMIFFSFLGIYKLILSTVYIATGNTEENSIVLVLIGIEYLLMAPLPFLVVWAVSRYISLLIPLTKDEVGSEEGANIVSAEHGIHKAKALFISLMSAILATDLVAKYLGDSAPPLEEVAGQVLVLFSLIWFFYVIGRTAVERS